MRKQCVPGAPLFFMRAGTRLTQTVFLSKHVLPIVAARWDVQTIKVLTVYMLITHLPVGLLQSHSEASRQLRL